MVETFENEIKFNLGCYTRSYELIVRKYSSKTVFRTLYEAALFTVLWGKFDQGSDCWNTLYTQFKLFQYKLLIYSELTN